MDALNAQFWIIGEGHSGSFGNFWRRIFGGAGSLGVENRAFAGASQGQKNTRVIQGHLEFFGGVSLGGQGHWGSKIGPLPGPARVKKIRGSFRVINNR